MPRGQTSSRVPDGWDRIERIVNGQIDVLFEIGLRGDAADLFAAGTAESLDALNAVDGLPPAALREQLVF